MENPATGPFWILVLAGAVAPACKSDSDEPPENQQASYSYPGCAHEESGCGRLDTLYCAAEAIYARTRAAPSPPTA